MSRPNDYEAALCFRVPACVLSALDAEARRCYTSRSEIVRQLLLKGLGMIEPAAKEAQDEEG